MASTGDLRSLLGPANFSTIPSNTAVVLQQAWSSHTDTLRSQLEKVKVDAEQKVAELSAANSDLSSKLAVYSQETERGQSALQQYREQAADSGTTAARLTSELSLATSEREDLRRQLFTARAERDDMAGLAERRQGEVERLAGQIKSLTEQVVSAQDARSEALVRMEEVESREVQLGHKEKRLVEEKEFMSGQVKMLQEELERRGEEVLCARREAGHKLAEMTQELAEQTEEARAAVRKEDVVRQEAEELRSRAEQLAERLKEARDSEGKLEDKFRAELAAQTKLATLYKSHSDEHTGKVEELSSAVTELQDLLKESSGKYGKLETELACARDKQKEEAENQGETIIALKKELEDSNKLIKTFREKGLSEDSIESLSPSAAHASRLLKSGLTVTGIYSQMVGLGEELTKEKQETARLNLYIQQILEEVESRAPQLKKQREDYEKVMAAVGGLTEQLESAREEVELRRSEAEEARRRLNTVERERNRLELQVTDLGKQVTTLVKDVDTGRGAGRRQSPRERQQQQMDTASADSVIEGRLLTFHNVAELQQKNIELLAVVRELSAGQEAAEASRLEEKTAEVRQELDTALRQVEELRTARERQQLMVENIIQQKEMYKSMVSGQAAATPTVVGEGDKQKVQKELEEVRKDFVEYKEEKAVNDKMVTDTVNKLRDDLHEARLKVAKLSSQEEYSTERFKIMSTNHESLKRQLAALEDRNKQLHNISGKHEDSVTALRRELMECQNKLSRAEVQSEHLQMKNSQLSATHARLGAERDVLLKEKSSNSRIEANLQQIQLNLERNDELGKMKLQSSHDQLQKEVELLRKKAEMEQDQYRDSVRTWELANKELREKSDASLVGEKSAMEQLSSMSTTLETMKGELLDTTERLELAESRLAGRGLGRQGSVMEGQGEPSKNRLRDVELIMAQTKQELKSVNTQLAEAKRKADEYKGISEAAEARMVESSATMQELQGQLEGRVKKAESEKELVEKKAGHAEIENRELKIKVAELESEAGASGGELRDRLKNSIAELEEIKVSMVSAEGVEKEAKEEAARLGEEAREAQEKYERELILHAKDIEALNKMKTEIRTKKSDKTAWESERKRINEKMTVLAKKHNEELQILRSESLSVSQQLEAVSGENKCLHKQLERVSQQMTDMTATGLNTSGAGDTSVNTSINTSINEEEANSTQLMAIIKYLRKEKDILSSRFEVLQAETARIQSQLDHQIRIAADSQATLDRERQVQSQSIMSASKHGELIRKVETLSAVTDSNRMLREEKDKLLKEVEKQKETASKAESVLAPLEEKLQLSEEKASTLLVEKVALQADAKKWKERSDQLVEKSFKINPQELQKLQDTKIQLTRSLNTLGAEKKLLEDKLTSQTKDMEVAKQQLTTAQMEAKKNQTELQEKAKEHMVIRREGMAAKNVQSNLSKEINTLKKKLEDLDKAKGDLNTNLATAVNKHKLELAKVKKEADESKTSSDDSNKTKKDLEEAQKTIQVKETEAENLKKTLAEKESEIGKQKATTVQLKKIGRNFREKNDAAEKSLVELTEEKKKVEEELAKVKADGVPEGSESNSDELEEAQKLLEESQKRLSELETQIEEVKKENEVLVKSNKDQQVRAKDVLKNARTKIQKTEEEKTQLKQELEELTAGSSSEEQDLRRKALASQLNSMRQDKDRLETEKNEAVQEKEKLMEEVEKLQQELVASQLSAQGGVSKPVAVAGVVQQQEKPSARKQQQPQAHIQPHRHQPRDFDRHTQTASIRPMAQRATTQAVVLPSQVSGSGQVEVATVQPTVSISPSVSSAGGTSATQLPTTSQPPQLDPAAAEFYPAAGADQGEIEPPRAVITPRQDQPQASTSGPNQAALSNAPSTSGASGHGGASPSIPTTASVPPTLKRPRDSTAPDSDSQSGEERAGPSGYQKKARTISSTEFLQVSSGGAEVVEMGGVSGSQETVESDSSMQVEVGERREVGSSSSMGVDMVGTSGEMAASSGVATSSQEEVLDSEQEGDEEDGEISEDMEEVEGQDLNTDNLDESSEEDEENDQEVEAEGNSDEEIEVGEPEGVVEDNSSEPSSSTGARQVGRGIGGSSLPGPGQVGFEPEQGETDSVVPTTPKLPLPRRNDGFAEAVSSPQVPSSDRFVFGSGQASSGPDVIVTSSNSGLPGQEGLDRTAVDIQQFATGGGAGGQQEEVEEGEVGGGDSEEGGVSSIVSSSEQQGGQTRPARARQAIVWEEGASSGSTSTSPQRQPGVAGVRSERGGRGTLRGATARRSRPGPTGAKRGQ